MAELAHFDGETYLMERTAPTRWSRPGVRNQSGNQFRLTARNFNRRHGVVYRGS
jgi:hypothetical protein